MVRHEEALACAIARYHFKPIVAEIVRLLFIHPASTLLTLSSLASPFFDSLSARSANQHHPISHLKRLDYVRHSLAVLLQHGIVTYEERFTSAPPPALPPSQSDLVRHTPTHIVYYCNIHALLYRPRIPLYLGFVRRRFGELGQSVLRTLFERGRLTSSIIFGCSLSHKVAEHAITDADAEACLTDMLKSGLLHWCGKRKPRSSLLEKTISTHFEAQLHNVGAKRPNPFSANNHLPHHQLDDDDDDGDDDDHNRPMIQIGRGDHVRTVGAPNKHNDKDIWGICFWHLNREFRVECCTLVVSNRIPNELAVLILRVGLEIALSREDCLQPSEDFETAEIHIDDIRKGLEDFGMSVGTHHFWDAAQLLTNHDPPFVIAVPAPAPSHLKFVPGRIVAETRAKTAEELILSRYGGVGRRIFQALALEGAMEERMLAEKCMLPLKVMREHVFRMYQDRIIATQEVPRSNDQQRASNWFYLWRVNLLSIHRNLLQIMYKTLLNLFLQYELLNRDNKTPEEKNKFQKREALIIACILRVDQSVMVMRDFGAVTAAYFPSKYEVLDGYIMPSKKRRRRAT